MRDSPAVILYDIEGTPIKFGVEVDTDNSTVIPLGSGGSFVGATTDVRKYHEIDINLAGAPSNASGTLYFEFSPDGTNWDVSIPLTLTTPTLVPLSLRIILPYFRVRYINGSISQSEFRLTTLLHRQASKTLTRFLNQQMDFNEPVENMRAVIAGQRPDDTFGNVPVSRNNFLKVSIDDVGPIAEDRLFAADKSIYGHGIVIPRITQFSANFSKDVAAGDITSSTSGTGYISQPDGYIVVASGSAVTSSASITTTDNILNKPGREIYANFAVGFTLPTHADGYQRAGIYSATDGFFIGYNGLTFGLTIRKSNSDTFTSLVNFNGDLLDGNPNSTFTRDNVPEAFNPVYENVFRIRYGGTLGPVHFQILSPDGHWVTFHIENGANSSIQHIISKSGLPVSYEVAKLNADATDLIIRSGFLDAGTTEDLHNINLRRIYDNITEVGDSVPFFIRGVGDVAIQLSGTWTGTMQFEGTIDRTTWVSVSGESVNTGSSSASTSTNGVFRLNASGLTMVRVRASSFSSGVCYVYMESTNISTVRPAASVTVSDPLVTKRFDVDDPITNYIGEAAPGTLESEALWTIRRITYDLLGNPVSDQITAEAAAVWDDRAIEVYQ